MLRPLATIFLAFLTAGPAFADAKPQGTFSDWTVYTRDTGGDRICYALSEATDMRPASVTHGDIFFMVGSWRSGAATEQPSFLAGYPLKVSSPPKARVGSTRVPMYASQNEAFIEAGSDEQKLVKSMRRGATMRVDAVSERGTATSYEFSLKGITAALKKAKALCN